MHPNAHTDTHTTYLRSFLSRRTLLARMTLLHEKNVAIFSCKPAKRSANSTANPNDTSDNVCQQGNNLWKPMETCKHQAKSEGHTFISIPGGIFGIIFSIFSLLSYSCKKTKTCSTHVVHSVLSLMLTDGISSRLDDLMDLWADNKLTASGGQTDAGWDHPAVCLC